ncbi:MAG: peptide ABC transporter substrate-binding protein [Ruminococcus sp.]|nr:peptide ABC transporter substrate-binding protein [Ruminococcus sp.]
MQADLSLPQLLTDTREKKVKKTAFLLSFILCAAMLPSCGNDDKEDGSGHMYDVPLNGNPQSLDPQFACDPSSNTVIKNLYSGLMQIDQSGNVVCCNAESFKVSEDGMVYTFTLRDDNFWFYDQNDDDVITEDEYFPVTAKDYAFALRRILDPQMKSPYRDDFACIMGAYEVMNGLEAADFADIYAPDDTTLQIVLNAPNAEFLRLMASAAAFPCNEEFFDSTKGRYGLDDRSVMSNGAFFVRQWFFDPYGSNNILYMKRNDANWSETYDIMPSFLSFTIEDSEEAVREVFKKEEIECLTSLSSSPYNPEKYLIEGIPATTLGLVFNPDDKHFSCINLRKALSLAIDRDELDAELGDDLQAAGGIIPPALTVHGRSYRELVSDKPFCAYSSEQANECYEAAKTELQSANFGQVKILVNAETANSSALRMVTQKWQDVLGLYIGIEDVSAEEFQRRIEAGDYSIALYPLKGRLAVGSDIIRELENIPPCKGAISESSIAEALVSCDTAESLVEKYSEAEKLIIHSYCFVPVFYKNSYLIADRDNEDIFYDPFTEAVDYRLAQNYD